MLSSIKDTIAMNESPYQLNNRLYEILVTRMSVLMNGKIEIHIS
jgi:hypothetical protein